MKEEKWFFTKSGYEYGPFNSKYEALLERARTIEKDKYIIYSDIFSVYIDMEVK